MTTLRRLSIAALAAVLLVAPGASQAQGTLDQSQRQAGASGEVLGFGAVAQTFTAGRSGNLVRVELYVGLGPGPRPEEPLLVEIQSVSAGGTPSGTVLAHQFVPASMVISPAYWIAVQFDQPAPSRAGTQYAIVVSALGLSVNESYTLSFEPGNPYRRGERLFLNDPPPQWLDIGGDLAFATYVESVGAPPDPTQEIPELRALVAGLGLHHGLTRSLHSKLAAALAALATKNTAGACGPLRAFLNHIAAQRGKKLTVAQAQQLSDSASDLSASLDCDDRGRRRSRR